MPHPFSATSSVSLFMAITAIVVIIMDSTIHLSSSYSMYLIKSKLRWRCSNGVVVGRRAGAEIETVRKGLFSISPPPFFLIHTRRFVRLRIIIYVFDEFSIIGRFICVQFVWFLRTCVCIELGFWFSTGGDS
ncbi:hypothetical protein Hanom_Chr01g00074761 [Helianthus anomalus]